MTKEEHDPIILTRELKLRHWGEGPWVDEDDRKNFDHCGLKCLVIRYGALEGPNNEYLYGGQFNGYVWIGLDDFDLEPIDENSKLFKQFTKEVEVHGGVTYHDINDKRILIGFDCAHSGDIVPSVEAFIERNTHPKLISYNIPPFNPTYKDIDFAIQECKKMAEQVRSMIEDYFVERNDDPS